MLGFYYSKQEPIVMKLRIACFLLLTPWISSTAFANDEECKAGPKDQWKSVAEAKAKVELLGYKDITKLYIEDNCYEAIATGPDGKVTDVLLDPVTLELFKTETPD
jgi:hypothetical protein